MANIIQIKRHATYSTDASPANDTLAYGELAWNNEGKKLFIGRRTSASAVTSFQLNPVATITTPGLSSFATADFAVSAAGAVTVKALGISNGQLAGSIANSKLANSGILVGDGNTSADAVALGATLVIEGTANEVTASQSSGTVTVGLPDDVTVGGDLVITGDLTVNGDTVTANVGTIEVEDKTIEVAKTGSPTDTTANGAGLIVTGADEKSIKYASSGDKWTMNKPLTVTGVVTATSGNSTNWNSAYGWGNHALGGYLTGLGTAVLDGDFGSAGICATNGSGTYSIVTNNSTNWDTAYGWGNHATASYLTSLGTAVLDGDFSSAGLCATNGSGTYSIVADSSTNWDTAYTDRLKWSGTFVGNATVQATARTNIGVTTALIQGAHAAYTARAIDTSGVDVIDVLTVDATGHVSNATKRTLALSDFGAIDGGTVAWS